VQSIFDKYQASYTSTTKTDFTRALTLDTALAKAIGDAWSANAPLKASADLPKFQATLAGAMADLKTQLAMLQPPTDTTKAAQSTDATKPAQPTDTTKPTQVDPGMQIVSALEDVKRSYVSLSAMLVADNGNADLTKTASDLAAQCTRDLIATFVSSRQDTVKTFATAVTVSGEASN